MLGKKLVCFDLDHTLIYEIHSVMYLSVLNNRYDEIVEIEKREAEGEFDWIEADYYKAELACGLEAESVSTEFNRVMKPINNIAAVVDRLHGLGFKCIVITAGPKQVAKAASEVWRLDGYYGSDYEVVGGRFTGKIINHIGDKGKIACLEEYCSENGINPGECIAVGDGASDIPLFEYCGCSIAINCRDEVKEKAAYHVKTDNLLDILDFIENRIK